MSDFGIARGVGSVEITLDSQAIVRDVLSTEQGQRLVHQVKTGETLRSQIHGEDYDFFLWSAQWVLNSAGRRQSVQLRWARPNGRWSRVCVTLQNQSNQTLSLVLSPDEAEHSRRTETQLRRVVEGSAQGIVVRTNSDVLYTNDAFAHLVGFSSAQELAALWERERIATGDPDSTNFVHPDDRQLVAEHMRRRIAGDETVSNYEFRLVRRDGSTVWVDTRASFTMWDGQPASLSWMSDITNRKHIEGELIRSKEAAELANRTKTEFLANMSHELRTPLNAIIGFAEVIKDEMFGPTAMERYADYARDIHRSGRHLLTLINDILDLAKLEAGKLDLHEEDVSLSDVIAECITLLRNRAQMGSVELKTELDFSVGKLHSDERALKQIVLNFLSNAVKFTPPGGTVTTRVRRLENGIAISVTDTGIGMSAQQIEVALSPFGQIDSKIARKHKGTGLGLPISRQLVELHGGTIVVESTPNQGTTLTAIFPAARLCEKAA